MKCFLHSLAWHTAKKKNRKVNIPDTHTSRGLASAQILFEVSMYLIRACGVLQIFHRLCTFELQTTECANLVV